MDKRLEEYTNIIREELVGEYLLGSVEIFQYSHVSYIDVGSKRFMIFVSLKDKIVFHSLTDYSVAIEYFIENEEEFREFFREKCL